MAIVVTKTVARCPVKLTDADRTLTTYVYDGEMGSGIQLGRGIRDQLDSSG